MSGREIEHLLSIMDANILQGRASLKKEVLRYLVDHESEVLAALRSDSGQVCIPTSAGKVAINLRDLEALVA